MELVLLFECFNHKQSINMKGNIMNKTDKKILQAMGLMSIAILIGVFIQHGDSEDVSVQLSQEPETFFEDSYVEPSPDLEPTESLVETLIPQSELATTPTSLTIESDSFGEAFAQAREQLGPDHTFIWNGQSYSTQLADETQETQEPEVKNQQTDEIDTGSSLVEADSQRSVTFPDGPDFVKAE